jgi:hypothetical protein
VALSLLAGCAPKEPVIDIWTAAATGETEVIEQHLAFGTLPNVREPVGDATPLIVAAVFGQTESARVLIEGGATIDATNRENSTALHTAAFFAHPELVAYLLEQGADAELRNNYGTTALDSVSDEWSPRMEGVYKMFEETWGLDLDLDRIREARPKVAELLRAHAEQG